jgi:RNA polymerase sigma-70 factor (family 1)
MAAYQMLSDAELTNLLKESNHDAYNEIYRRYHYLLFVHAYKKLRNEEQVKDVIQELFATLWFKREMNFISTNLSGYLYTAIRNKIFDLFAHEKVKSNYLLSFNDFIRIGSVSNTDHLVREKELKAYIEKEIQALPPKMRSVFEMSRKEHLSYKEIADKTGTTENNVSKQVNNALRILRTKLGLVMYIYFLMKF